MLNYCKLLICDVGIYNYNQKVLKVNIIRNKAIHKHKNQKQIIRTMYFATPN